ncbi:MAG: ribonuclease R [Kiloniellales bacterium]|nr:ribonuclease R [Kiloniellales bacterium]
MAAAKRQPAPFPSKDEVLAFIREQDGRVGKREIARAFQLKGQQRIALKALLKELAAEGHIERDRKRRVVAPGRLPSVTVIEAIGRDPDGELLGRPAGWSHDAPPPTIYIAPFPGGHPSLGEGERVLARLKAVGEGLYEARPMRVVGAAPRRVLGIYRPKVAEGRLVPTDKRAKREFVLRPEDAGGARNGDLVLAELLRGGNRLGLPQVRVVERLSGPGSLSLISLFEHGIPIDFPKDALKQAETAGPPSLGEREDLRQIPLVTIDGEDARDFDDAVWAAPESGRGASGRGGGWRVLVAIADVAHYVTADSPLDRSARERGNSVYFPDRVVPMLPEALSNGWCSLRPKEERGCLAVEMRLDSQGRIKTHRFFRGLMRSAARLTYTQVQAAIDGRPDETTAPLLDEVIKPLYGAYAALLRARERRGTLDLDLPERRVMLDAKGRVAAIEARERLDSHRLIEEFMIAANVAAAETLESRQRPCLYRVHDGPDPVKVEALRQFLETLDLRLARGQVLRPKLFTRLLEQVRGGAEEPLVNELVLRCQSQAAYSPRNLGHFGLALTRYAHFTSPIRRYADLLVHRSLISALGLGRDGLPGEQAAAFTEIGAHISSTERRAAAAERDAVDRFTAAFLAERVGEAFSGRISSVTRFGLFVSLDESGADGLVPISALPDDYYEHDEAGHCLVGQRWGRVYNLGDRVALRLVEASPVTGGLILHIAEDSAAADAGRGRTNHTIRKGQPKKRPVKQARNNTRVRRRRG